MLVASRGGIRAFAAKNGEKLWESETVRNIFRAPAVYDGQVFAVGNVDKAMSLVSLSLEDGSKRWQSELTSGPGSAGPVATQHGVILFDDRSIVVHDRESGERSREIYSFDESDGRPDPAIAADDGTVFVTSSFGAVAVDIDTGTEQWHRDAPAYHRSICVGAETVVFPFNNPEFSSGYTTISALDRESGETRWYYGFDLSEDPNGMSVRALVDGAVFFTSSGNLDLAVLGDVDE